VHFMKGISSMESQNRLLRWFSGATLPARINRLAATVSFLAALDQFVNQINPATRLVKSVNNSPFDTILCCLVLFLLVELLFFQRSLPEQVKEAQRSEKELFSSAIVRFARHLQESRRHGPLLLLRDNLSHLLHLLHAHTERIELGRLALAAAVEDKSDIHRALILIDDLGWAFSEMNDPTQAKRNIAKGISIAQSSSVVDPLQRSQLFLAQAKGLRHLAMLSNGKAEAMDYLRQATDKITSLKANEAIMIRMGDDVKRDEAQLKHAEASLLAKDLGLDKVSSLPITDVIVLQAANSAIKSAEEAATIFESIHDDERHAKALMLVKQIQKRLGMEVDAIETIARIRRVLRDANT
jgi:hypothetical protein